MTSTWSQSVPGVIPATASARLPKSADRMDGATRRVGASVGEGSTVAIEPSLPAARGPHEATGRPHARWSAPEAVVRAGVDPVEPVGGIHGPLALGLHRHEDESGPVARPHLDAAQLTGGQPPRTGPVVRWTGGQHPEALGPERGPGPSEPDHPSEVDGGTGLDH